MSIRIVYSPLRKKDSKELVESFCRYYPRLCSALGVSPASTVYEAAFGDEVIYVIDGIPVAFRAGDAVVPTLVTARMVGLEAFHYAIVDEGAVRPILNGADVMAPGIVRASGFDIGDIVVVWSKDEKTPLAVAQALVSSSEVMSVRKGKALRNLHHAGDDVWKASLEVLKKFGRV